MATAGAGRGAGPERAFHAPLPASGAVRLDREESHHLVRVRRARPGDAVVLFDGRGATRLARLADADATGARVEIEGDAPDREPPRAVTVAVALPAAGRADDLVSALAELGVARVVPLLLARTAPDAAEAAERRRERFARLAREAAKVNGRSRLLEISPATTLAAALAEVASGASLGVLLDTDPALPGLPSVLASLGARPVVLLVGPEGGFTPAEAEAATAAGARAASLGACALRTETAAVVAAGIALASCPPR